MEYEQFAEKFIEELENAMKPEKVESYAEGNL